MKFIVATLLSALAGLTAGLTAESSSLVHGDRTITKVVKLLQGMLEKSKEDAEKDRDLYSKFKCYCDKNEVQKGDAIPKFITEIQLLESEISELQASSGELSAECAQLSQDMDANEAAMQEATTIRGKAEEDFKAEEKDLSGAIDSMGQAIDALAAIGGEQEAAKAAMLTVHSTQKTFMGNMGKNSLVRVKSTVKSAMKAADGQFTQKQKRVLQTFIQAPFTGTYTSQSGEIVGILKNMKETFTANLATARGGEKAAKEAHEKFLKIKTEEFDVMKTNYDAKQEALGANDESLGSKLKSLETAKDDLTDDQEFLMKLTVMCNAKAKQFDQRKMERANEEAAISQAVALLNSDAAFDTFGKSASTKSGATSGKAASFIQIGLYNVDHSSVRKTLEARLQEQARQRKSVKLARVAAMLELGNPFETVLKEIKKMITLIDEEQKADDEQDAWCKTERAENEETKSKKEAKVETLSNKIKELTDEIDLPETGIKATIVATEQDLTSNHESQGTETGERKQENMAYQKSIKNYVGAQAILEKVIKVLNAFYKESAKEKLELVQKEDPKAMEEYANEGDQSEKGGDVITMLEFINTESKKEEQEAHMDEEASQHKYEDRMKELVDAQAKMTDDLSGMNEMLAEKVKSLAETRAELAVDEKDLKSVERYLSKIEPGCDFIVKNIETRTKNRETEKSSMEEAVKTLEGTPAFKSAAAAAEQEALGACKDTCNADGKDHAKCKACLAGTSVPGYCAGHKDTAGC